MPRYPGFCGPSNQTQGLLSDFERSMNWYVEPNAMGSGLGPALYPTPGQREFLRVSDVGTRGGISVAGRTFAVVGGGLYELFSGGTSTKRGTVAADANPATVSYNGTAGGQLFIASGGNGYCYTLATNVLTQVLTGEATMGGMLSARFLAFNATNGRVRLSAQNDGTTWDPTLFFARTLAPDPWQAMLVSPPNIWLIGSQTAEVWYDSGAFPQPFAPVSGAFYPYGTSSTFSAAVVGEYVTWVSNGVSGQPQIIAARGFSPSPISNFAVEHVLSGYARSSTVSDAEVLGYGDEGHLFACFSFPTARGTWCFDFTTGLWHERGTWASSANRFEAWSPRVHLAAFGKHLVGSRTSSVIAEMDATIGTEADGGVIRRVRVAPPLTPAMYKRVQVARLQVFIEPGLGVASGQGSDPLVMLRTTGDGRRWSSEVTATAGRMGEYGTGVSFTRLGSSELLWAPEISVSDPTPWRVAGADVGGSGFEAGG
jgi:hypothetical protein